MITPDVEALRKRFKFPGMRILQFAFGGDTTNPYLPHLHEPDSVVYTGTHDNDTSVGWWAQAGEHERRFACDYLDTDGHDIAWTLIRAACASGGRHLDHRHAGRAGAAQRQPHEHAGRR